MKNDFKNMFINSINVIMILVSDIVMDFSEHFHVLWANDEFNKNFFIIFPFIYLQNNINKFNFLKLESVKCTMLS